MNIYSQNDEFIIELREWCKNNPLDLSNQETFQKPLPAWNKGLKHLDSTKKKLSLKNQHRGKSLPEELKNKISLKLKGRVFSEQHLKRKSEAQKKKIMINGVEYDSGRSAALANNVCPATIVKWLKNGKAQYI